MKIRTNNIMSLHSTVLGVLIVFMGILSACGGGSESSPTRAATPQSAEVPNATIQAVSGSTTVPGIWTGRASVLTVNTNWTPKTIITNGKEAKYIFGLGNPTEVALRPSEYIGNATTAGKDYVTPKVEKLLLSFLSNPSLLNVIKSCRLDAEDSQYTVDVSGLDINKILIIDPTTGRKSINSTAFDDLISAAETIQGQMDGKYSIYGPKNIYATCVKPADAENFSRLLSDLRELFGTYDATYRDVLQ